ncbi:hypothetical protein Celaphus_00019334 [Cervus elaphus hippelaphus]|uniref:Uncharacterized protein n=1 Tax=Cervus elaphus hippelaphus TaxID=46360 RepID=A0A212C2M3_CEREH|nr:hypothetical protein Celaphus_00019334 [Cervus elaphus hippelaphus]
MSKLAGIETDMMLTGFNCQAPAPRASPLSPLIACPDLPRSAAPLRFFSPAIFSSKLIPSSCGRPSSFSVNSALNAL